MSSMSTFHELDSCYTRENNGITISAGVRGHFWPVIGQGVFPRKSSKYVSDICERRFLKLHTVLASGSI